VNEAAASVQASAAAPAVRAASPKLRRTVTAFSSEAGAAGLMDGHPIDDSFFQGGIALLIIDPQNDFHEGGSLAVPGATEDSRRIAEFIEANMDKIERVVVSLDTHHSMHIHNGNFWEGADGKMPDPFTIITKADVEAGTWKARDPASQAWALEYVEKLEAGGRFQVCIWPEHCILGSPGHAVHAPLMKVLDEWAVKRLRTVSWYFKGQNNKVEMYSAFKAEVEVPDDPTTKLDLDLVAMLQRHSKVVCCGEALSHCLNYSVRDLLSAWPKGREADIVVLEDAASPVPGFEDSATSFISDMKVAGVTVCKTKDFDALAALAEGKPALGEAVTVAGTAFSSKAGAAGLMDGDPAKDTIGGGSAIFLIDPQNDFHEGGSLAVPGATEDSLRIAELLKTHGDKIERVVVSIDTHHSMHIHNGNFWEGADGKNPDPFTIITTADVEAGTWRARDYTYGAWALEYVKKLEAGGRFQLCIWPSHCILGTEGHAVHAPLMKALSDWAISRKRTINWLFKGQNNRTEMYSALKAEVLVDGDRTADLDTDLIDFLARHDRVLCCGEAKSHCVNYSVRDLLSGWPKGREADIVVLEDATSPVPGFEESAETFISDMKAAGVTVCKCSEFVPPPMK